MMVRFRLSGDRPSTFEGGVAEESVPIAERWSSGKGLALTSSREIAFFSIRFAFALSARAPAPSSDCARDIRRDAVDSPSGTGAPPNCKVHGRDLQLPLCATSGRSGAA